MKFALITNGDVLYIQEFDVKPPTGDWRELIEPSRPEYDGKIHTLVYGIPTINETNVVLNYTIVPNMDKVPIRIVPAIYEVDNWALEEELIERGVDTALKAAINSLSNPKDKAKATARFAKKPKIKRYDPLIAALAAGLGWSVAYVDDLFVKADLRSKT